MNNEETEKEIIVIMEKPIRKDALKRACNICHGFGVIEIKNGADTIDCPNRSCKNGYIEINKQR